MLRLLSLFWGALGLLCAFFPLPGVAAGLTELKLGVLPAADSIVLHAAVDDGLFLAEGLDVTLVPFQSALELGAAMRAGALQGQFGDIINILNQRDNGVDQAIIATTTHSGPRQRYFGLVVSPASKAQNLADLKGADIAVSSATIIDFLLTRLLDREQLPPDYFQRQDIRQISIRLQMLLSGRLEAALLPEPLVSLVEARGARTLLDDRGLDTPLAVISLRREFTQPGTVSRFRAALTEAARRIDADPEKYKKLMIAKGLLPNDAAPAYAMLRFDASRESGLPPLPTAEDITLFAEWMRAANMLREIPAYGDVVVP